jgi:hypothetical protein
VIAGSVAVLLSGFPKLGCPAARFGGSPPEVIVVAGVLVGQRFMDPSDFFLGRGQGSERDAHPLAQVDGSLDGRGSR